jgi:hypothetical protein
MHCISIVRCLHFRIFSASFFITFLSPGIATSISIYVPFSLSRIMISCLLLGAFLSDYYYYYYYYCYSFIYFYLSDAFLIVVNTSLKKNLQH